MKIAIFHNYLDNIGGAEKVGLTLARELNADVYTTNIDEEKIEKMGFADVLPRIFSIGKVPISAPFRQQLALWKFRRLNLRDTYDFYIIGGDWAMSAAVNNKPNLWYVHSPIREIWDLYEDTKKNIHWTKKLLFVIWARFNRHLNKKYSKRVTVFACNSNNTAFRLKQYLKKDAAVIPPPVETSKFFYAAPKNYWLSVNRLINHKRVDMQLKAFEKLPAEKLIIVGSYEKSPHFKQYAEYIKKIKPENVEIKSWVSQDELIRLYSGCKGFVATSKDEDFGMNAVEAMAAGKPVIAPNEGGYKETMINGKTGTLIDDIDENKLISAIKKINKELENNSLYFKEHCMGHAKNFDTQIFIKKIKKIGEKYAS